MGLGVRFDPRVIETPVGVLGDLLDELVGALAKSAKGSDPTPRSAAELAALEPPAPPADSLPAAPESQDS